MLFVFSAATIFSYTVLWSVKLEWDLFCKYLSEKIPDDSFFLTWVGFINFLRYVWFFVLTKDTFIYDTFDANKDVGNLSEN